MRASVLIGGLDSPTGYNHVQHASSLKPLRVVPLQHAGLRVYSVLQPMNATVRKYGSLSLRSSG